MERALVVFIKNPEKGKVKTRIAADLGEEKALLIYHKLLAYTRLLSEKVNANRYLYYSSSIQKSDSWSETKFRKVLQVGSTLGEKMWNAFSEVREQKKVIIGSDCPQLTSRDIEEAFHQLEEVDLVIGPANDGGYYLLGIKEVHAELFLNMTWSVESVFEETIRRANKLSLKIKILRELVDLDTVEDIKISGFILKD